MAIGSREELWAMFALAMAPPSLASVIVDPDAEELPYGTTFTIPISPRKDDRED